MISDEQKREFQRLRETPVPTLHSLFMRNSRETPDAAAFLVSTGDRSVPIPWRDFIKDVEKVAWAIQTRLMSTPEAKQRCVIGILGENSYSWMVAHAACLFSGAVAMPIDPALTPVEMAERLRFTGARFVAYSALYASKAKAAQKLLPGVGFGAFADVEADKILVDAQEALANGAPSPLATPPDEDGRIAMLVFTSGTTSKPRGVELTMRGLALFAANAARSVPINPGDHSLMMLPLHHIFGIAVAYTFLANRVAMGVCPDFRRLFDAVQRFRCNHLFLVPALADILAQKISRRGSTTEEALGTKIKWIGTGGAPLSPNTYKAFTSLGVTMLDMYGLTETTALCSKDCYAASKPG
ncbi:MAG: acyl--CoA ligase, partial [Kiritimatiellae bacterium]|nr:acyl--CoA ligase [Kiritimatiellia bacterium]